MLEHHHGVRILEEAVEGSVRLSARYIPGRQLPDKSVSLLDTACARVAISQSAIPPAVEDCRRQIDNLKVEIEILERETETGAHHAERLVETQEALTKAESSLVELQKRWEEERKLVQSIRGLADQIEKAYAARNGSTKGSTPTRHRPHLESLRSELAERTSS